MTSIILKTGASKRTAVRTGALLVLGLALSGCAVGVPGYQHFVDGHYQTAHDDFVTDYRNYPNDSVAQLNMASSYRQRGEQGKANALFHDAAYSGRGVIPDGMSERHEPGTTVADVACRYLAEDHQRDSNCPTL